MKSFGSSVLNSKTTEVENIMNDYMDSNEDCNETIGETIQRIYLETFPSLDPFGKRVSGLTVSNGELLHTCSYEIARQADQKYVCCTKDRLKEEGCTDEVLPLIIFDYADGLREGVVLNNYDILWNYGGFFHSCGLGHIRYVEKVKSKDYIILHYVNGGKSDRIPFSGISHLDLFVEWMNDFFKGIQEELFGCNYDTSGNEGDSLGEIVIDTFFDIHPDFSRFGNKVFGLTIKNDEICYTCSEAIEQQIYSNFLVHLEKRNDYDEDDPEGPLIAFDYSGNMSKGFVITERHFMWNYSSKVCCINIEKIVSATKQSFFLTECMVLNTSNSGPTERLFLTGIKNSDDFVKWLNSFLSEVQKRIS